MLEESTLAVRVPGKPGLDQDAPGQHGEVGEPTKDQ